MFHTVYAEWKKIWFPKLSRAYLLFTVVFSVAMGLLFVFTTNVTQNRRLAELDPMEVISVNMLAIDVSTILLIFFTAVLIGREFHNKTIQIYLAATPNRTQYFAVKALFFLGVSLATGVLAALIALGNGWLILEALHHQILSVPEVMQFAAGCIFMPLFYALMTVCAAFFSRSSAVGITIPFIIIFLPAITKLFPQSVQNIFIPILPASAIHSLSGAAEKGTLEDMGSLTALVILGIWSLLACLLALWRFRQKDI